MISEFIIIIIIVEFLAHYLQKWPDRLRLVQQEVDSKHEDQRTIKLSPNLVRSLGLT